jgi:gluconolactonase
MKLEGRTLTTGLMFPEGPIAMPDGAVIVVEIEGAGMGLCQ